MACSGGCSSCPSRYFRLGPVLCKSFPSIPACRQQPLGRQRRYRGGVHPPKSQPPQSPLMPVNHPGTAQQASGGCPHTFQMFLSPSLNVKMPGASKQKPRCLVLPGEMLPALITIRAVTPSRLWSHPRVAQMMIFGTSCLHLRPLVTRCCLPHRAVVCSSTKRLENTASALAAFRAHFAPVMTNQK